MEAVTRAVIGPGLMGHGIALVMAKVAGDVWLCGESDAVLAVAMTRIDQSLQQLSRYDLVQDTTRSRRGFARRRILRRRWSRRASWSRRSRRTWR